MYSNFVVNTEGYIENLVIETEPGDGTGNEVLRILSKMNMQRKMDSGKKNGKNVAAFMTLPVNFGWTENKITYITLKSRLLWTVFLFDIATKVGNCLSLQPNCKSWKQRL